MSANQDEATRRAFLRAAMGLTATAELWPGAIARAMEIPAAHRTGTIMDVEHVVIFMQENRSFDHYFGTLSGVRGFADPLSLDLARRRRGLAAAGRKGRRGGAVQVRHRRHQLPCDEEPASRLGHRPRGLERGALRQLDRGQGRADHGPPGAGGHSLSLRPGRRVHGLRRLFLVAAGADLSKTASI